MSSRRDKGEGAAYKAGGRWVAVLSQGYRAGKRIRRYFYSKPISRGGKKSEAIAKLKAAQVKVQRGVPVSGDRVKLEAYLAEHLRNHVEPNNRASTARLRVRTYRNYLVPHLGHLPIGEITTAHVREMLRRLKAKGLKASTIRGVHDALRSALQVALRDEVLMRNVASLVRPPKSQAVERPHLTLEELHRLLAAYSEDGHRQHRCAVVLASFSGLRNAEIRGLRWQDIDSKAKLIRVRWQWDDKADDFAPVKSDDSLRDVPAVLFIRSELEAQRLRLAEWKLAIGSMWTEMGLVCPNAFGVPMGETTLWAHLQKVLDAIGLERRSFHALRHTFSSLLREAGIDIETARKWLGHAAATMTMHYTHTDQKAMDEAAEKLQALAPPAS